MIPIIWLLCTSFSAYPGINIRTFFPEEWTLDNYKLLLFNADTVAQFPKWFMNTLVIAGGVSANQYIKSHLLELCKKYDCSVITPPLKLCTDNGVMAAWGGLERFKCGLINDLTACPKSRWELEDI